MAGLTELFNIIEKLAPELRTAGARYRSAYEAGQITQPELEGFVQALQKQAPAPRQPGDVSIRLRNESSTAAPTEKSAFPVDRVKDAFEASKARQGGISGAYISDLVKDTGLPKEDVHNWLLEQARAGKLTIHPSTSVDIPQAVKDAAIKLPGFDEPFTHVIPKSGLFGAAAAAGGAAAALAPGSAKASETSWKPVSTEPARGAAPWKPVATQPITPAPSQGSSSWIAKAIEPITSYPATQRQMAGEAVGKMGEGMDAAKEGSYGKAAWDVGTGAMDYAMSPLDAALRTIVGKPIEENTHGVIKKEWPEFAASLVLPGIGLSRAPAVRSAAKEVEKVFSPSTVSPMAQKAAGDIRAASGTAARESATTEAALEPFHAVINKLPEADRYQFIDYVESRGSGAQLPGYMQSLQPIADTMRTAFDRRMVRLQNMPSTATASFIDDYFPHMWKDQNAARNFANNFGAPGRQGSRASLHKRTVPTIADGIAAGLEPVTSNPLEATLRYTRSMDQFIASQEVLDAAKAQGTVRYIRPKVMGASGNPNSYKVPPGWVPLQGRGATNAMGAVAHAPEDWARVYNNYISKGFFGNAEAGKWYDAARRTSNYITGMELGLSGFHAFTMANEAIISGVAKGIQEISKGRPIAGVGSIITAPAKPFTNYLGGKKIEQIYLGRNMGSTEMRKVTELLEKAGGRAKGASHAVDYEYSAMGSFWNSWNKGSLKLEAAAATADIKARPIIGSAKVAATLIGRTMSTIAGPLFETYIPRVKNGAFYDTMSSWLKSHPGASQDEELEAARRIWNSIDNRFGELVQDNLFWNKTLQQSAQLAMRSYSWNIGTAREIGGGAIDLAQSVLQGKELSERAAYVIAMPVVVAALNATYQYFKTGEAPKDVRDLVAGRTGGEDPDSGQPERIALPGYQKDIIGWHDDWTKEITNKASGLASRSVQLFNDEDWRGDPIRDPNGEMADIMQQYLNFVVGSLTPISVKNQRKEGTNIGYFESKLGLTPARRSVQDPEGWAEMRERIGERAWQTKLKHDEREKQRYGGPTE